MTSGPTTAAAAPGIFSMVTADSRATSKRPQGGSDSPGTDQSRKRPRAALANDAVARSWDEVKKVTLEFVPKDTETRAMLKAAGLNPLIRLKTPTAKSLEAVFLHICGKWNKVPASTLTTLKLSVNLAGSYSVEWPRSRGSEKLKEMLRGVPLPATELTKQPLISIKYSLSSTAAAAAAHAQTAAPVPHLPVVSPPSPEEQPQRAVVEEGGAVTMRTGCSIVTGSSTVSHKAKAAVECDVQSFPSLSRLSNCAWEHGDSSFAAAMANIGGEESCSEGVDFTGIVSRLLCP
ncbi:unnamed protein product [Chrysoparadoxa australica]